MTPTPLLALHDIHFTYPSGRSVLRSANITLHHGQRLGLLGHNGSGKTTLLHVAMGLLTPQHGSITLNGNSMDASQPAKQTLHELRRTVGFLFQNSDDQLFCPTVLEDVAFGPLNLGLSPAEARKRAEDTLTSVGLAGFGPRVTYRLSGGEKKMAALASILAMQPQALLLDEPTNDLDPDTRQRLIAILGSVSRTHIIISHDWDFLARTCDTFLTVKDGTVNTSEHTPHAHMHLHTHVHSGGDVDHTHHDQNGHAHPHCHEHGQEHEQEKNG